MVEASSRFACVLLWMASQMTLQALERGCYGSPKYFVQAGGHEDGFCALRQPIVATALLFCLQFACLNKDWLPFFI